MHAQITSASFESQPDVQFSYVVTKSATHKVGWEQHECSFSSFAASMVSRGHRTGTKDGTGIVAAEVKEGSRLEDKNVERVTALILDVDGKVRENGAEIIRYVDPDEFLARLPFRGVAHTSFSHSKDLAKFRVIYPLAEPLPHTEFLRLWWWAYEASGRVCDPSCKNASRMFYLPRHPPDADASLHWVRELQGPLLSLNAVPSDFQIPSAASPSPYRAKTGLHTAADPARYRTTDPALVLDELLATPLYTWALEFPTQVSREAWRGLATNLAALVVEDENMYEACSQAFHNLSCVDPNRYNYGICEKTFRDAVKSARDVGPMTWNTLKAAGAPTEACEGHRERAPVSVARNVVLKRQQPSTGLKRLVAPADAPFIQEIKVESKGTPIEVPVQKGSTGTPTPPPADGSGPGASGSWADPRNFLFDASDGLWLQWDAAGEIVSRMSENSFTRALMSVGHDKKSAEAFKCLCSVVSNKKYFYDRSDRIVVEGGVSYLNLYRPSSLEPVAGDWEPIRQLIVNLCGGDLTGVEFVLDWLAKPLQSIQNGKPWRALTALVFHGQPGSGKGTLATMMRAMYGLSNSVEVNQEVLDGRFNDMLAGKLFVLCNEVISGSNREDSTFNKIKPWVTDEYVNIERKFSDRQEVVPTFNIIFMSNDKRPVPVAQDDRRYIIFSSRKLPEELSSAVWEDIHGDRKMLAAFYAALLTRQTKIEKGQIYETSARRELMHRTLKSWDSFALILKEDGWMSISRDWVGAANPNGPLRSPYEKTNFVSGTTLMAVYVDYCKSHGMKSGAYQQLVSAIKEHIPEAKPARLRLGKVPVRGWEDLPAGVDAADIPVSPADEVPDVLSMRA